MDKIKKALEKAAYYASIAKRGVIAASKFIGSLTK